MKLNSRMILASSILLTACGGGGGGSGDTAPKEAATPPSNTEALTISAKPSQLDFEWEAVETDAGDNVCYQLSVNPDGVSGFTLLKVADDGDELTDSDEEYCTTNTQFSWKTPATSVNWEQIKFTLTAVCDNTTICKDLTTQGPSNGVMLDSIATIVNPYEAELAADPRYIDAGGYPGYKDGGIDISLDGKTMVIGSPLDRSDAIGSNGDYKSWKSPPLPEEYGAAYIYTKNNGEWTLDTYLKSNINRPFQAGSGRQAAGAGDRFGNAVSINDDSTVLAISALNHHLTDPNDPNFQSLSQTNIIGTTYIFTRIENTWVQTAQIFPSNTYSSGFGQRIRLSGDGNTLVVHKFNNGETHLEIFTNANNEWVFQNKLESSRNIADIDVNFNGSSIALSTTDGEYFNIFTKINGNWESHYILIPATEMTDLQGHRIHSITGGVHFTTNNTLLLTSIVPTSNEISTGITLATRTIDFYTFNNGIWSAENSVVDENRFLEHRIKATLSENGKNLFISSIAELRGLPGINPADTANIFSQHEISPRASLAIYNLDINSEWKEKTIINSLEFFIPNRGNYFLYTNDSVILLEGNGTLREY